MSKKLRDEQEGLQEETTNWNSWYILLVAVLAAQIAVFWMITNHFAE